MAAGFPGMDAGHGIDPNKSMAENYSAIYEQLFSPDPQGGYAALEKAMFKAEPGLGYALLAQILEKTRHQTVITTNFDNLVSDALNIFSGTFPIICGHELLAGFARPKTRLPLVAKIHRDLTLTPQSTRQDTATLEGPWKQALDQLFDAHLPIVIGYGGNDGSLMNYLKGREVPANHGHGLFWCRREDDTLSPQVEDVLRRMNGLIVTIPDFDSLLLQLYGALRQVHPANPLPDPNQLFESMHTRSQKRATALQEKIKAITDKLQSTPDQTIDQALSDLMDQNSLMSYMLQIWRAKQPDDKANLFAQAIERYPQDPDLLGDYANFMTNVCGDHDTAEELYKRAIDADPTHANNLGNYAIFMTDIRGDQEAAEELYKRAIDADPTHANSLGNYANFMKNVRGDQEAAEELYKRAIDADPTHANNLVNYAIFMTDIRGDQEAAEELYKRAIDADPTHANNLGNYAIFMTDIRGDQEAAEELYKRAIDADPTHANNLVNYAQFLLGQQRLKDASKILPRAMAQVITQENWTLACAEILLAHAVYDEATQTDATPSLARLKDGLSSQESSITWRFLGMLEVLPTWMDEKTCNFYRTVGAAIIEPDAWTALEAHPRWQALDPRPWRDSDKAT